MGRKQNRSDDDEWPGFMKIISVIEMIFSHLKINSQPARAYVRACVHSCVCVRARENVLQIFFSVMFTLDRMYSIKIW